MNRVLKMLTLAAPMAAVALTLTATSAQAQWIYAVQGGRTTVTVSPAFQAEIAASKAVVTSVYGSQVYNNKIDFPISSGAISLTTARGQVDHAGGFSLTAGTKEVRLFSLELNTLGEQAYLSALVVADGRFVGRINVFDVTVPSDIKLPITPNNGEFYLGGLELRLDPAGASALNDGLGVKVFTDNEYVGYAQALTFAAVNAQVTN